MELKCLEIISFLAQTELGFDFISLLFSQIYLFLLYHLCPQAGSILITLNYVTYPAMKKSPQLTECDNLIDVNQLCPALGPGGGWSTPPTHMSATTEKGCNRY